jgi:hypothetical protein
MSILFSPSGSLDVSKDPSDLPESADQNNISSGAMVRCKNLRINQQGLAKTRDGSAKLNATAIASISWLEVQAGVRYAFAGTSIYRDESSIASGLTNAQWAAIQYNAFNDTTQQVFALNGTDRKRIQGSNVYEWGIAAPTAAPTVRSGGGSGLTGEYNAKYTYVRKVGSVVVAESDPSPAAATSAVLSNGSLAIAPTQPTDAQVTHIRFYRTSANGLTYSYAGEVAANTTYAFGYCFSWESTEDSGTGYKFTTSDATHSTENTFPWEERFLDLSTTFTASTYSNPFDTFDSNITDGSLGNLVETDHDRPPLGSFVFGPAYDGTCFILKDNLLYYCKPKQPEYWPTLYFIEVGPPQFPLQTGVFHNGQPYVFSRIGLFYVQGTGNGTFFPLPMKSKTGAQSVRGAVSVDGKGIFHTGPDGIYLFASGADMKITEDSLEPLFRGETVQDMPGVADMTTAWLHVYRNHLYFGYRSAGTNYPTNVIVLNLETNRPAYFVYNDGSDVQIRAIANDDTNKRLLIGDNSGFVRVIESTSYTADSGTAIPWELQSKDYTLQTRKHFPRWAKYDVDASGAATCTGAYLLGGAVHQSHTITGSRDSRRRLIGTGNGNRAAIRISGTGPVTIYAVEAE